MPAVEKKGLWPAQLKAVRNLEASLAQDRPRALIHMATGSGKTFTAVTAAYLSRSRPPRGARLHRPERLPIREKPLFFDSFCA